MFTNDEQCPLSCAVYNYRPFLKLLCNKIPKVSELMGEDMFPTYSYARLYQHNETLKKHTDRGSCEISLTLHLGGDAPWPIWLTKPCGEKVEVNLTPGQAILYQGMVSEHWREAYQGNNYGQVFLHYVRADGEYWDHFGDKVN